ncbi:methyltransferase, FxLD system [Dactylosporangium vinaceum]|uniref:Protein-L-isoaspartate O-methyltransferase n=1 Tax=Dactylosporangium vinaceum TaxID=53362 RepID=A0ABV5M2Q2_9ACTN|nr:methyltransferase, FxLD system [Dactylosporangium vinaceum]UAB96354.1 methyltransferase, FxLD system [Dactylosporangium vinaceum]
MTDLATAPTADILRHQLADALVAAGAITSPDVERAVRTVPREVFAPPGTSLADAYADDVVITKRRADGQPTSSVSAPWLQARMIEQAGVGPGSRVLEVGSGGYNAALLAEVVGPTGAVTSVDIDLDVIGWARRGLDAAGYPQVATVVGDGEHGHLPGAPYDAIIVTVETADIPPAWREQLAPTGVLVAPVRMRGLTRSVAFTRDGTGDSAGSGDGLVARSLLMCGFVPMQGQGSIPEQHLDLTGGGGDGGDGVVVLRVDDDTTTVDPGALAEALRGPRSDVWSGITLPGNTSFETLLLWLTGQPVPYGRLFVDRDRAKVHFDGLLAPFANVSPAFLTADSLAYLVLRKLDSTVPGAQPPGESRWEFGAHGFGPDATLVATMLCDAVRAWDRHAPDPHIAVHPASAATDAASVAASDGAVRLLVPRRHATIVVSWSAPALTSAATA